MLSCVFRGCDLTGNDEPVVVDCKSGRNGWHSADGRTLTLIRLVGSRDSNENERANFGHAVPPSPNAKCRRVNLMRHRIAISVSLLATTLCGRLLVQEYHVDEDSADSKVSADIERMFLWFDTLGFPNLAESKGWFVWRLARGSVREET